MDACDASPFYDISYITFGPWAAEDIGAGQPHDQAIKSRCFGEDGTLNPAPRKVNDPKFEEESFFDPRDIMQVKYRDAASACPSTKCR